MDEMPCGRNITTRNVPYDGKSLTDHTPLRRISIILVRNWSLRFFLFHAMHHQQLNTVANDLPLAAVEHVLRDSLI